MEDIDIIKNIVKDIVKIKKHNPNQITNVFSRIINIMNENKEDMKNIRTYDIDYVLLDISDHKQLFDSDNFIIYYYLLNILKNRISRTIIDKDIEGFRRIEKTLIKNLFDSVEAKYI
tara:strand:- start:483 stop:833 length:351 start_codon:yes stop_codon:yes gene_type:complete